ncbi:MAG: glycosyltransferase [Nitrospiraceae bacterium]|nr:glycosyltransferase [Nitrospiraceae bacterium]
MDSKTHSSENNPEISVILPSYNEAPNIEPQIAGLLDALRPMGRRFEIIVVDDGSTDGGQEILKKLQSKTPELRVIIFRRNFGQSAAMTAGFDYSRGDIVVSMDGDLQNDPKDIPRLISRLEEGYDIVSGWRKDRKDPFISRKFPSLVANRIIGYMTGVRLHDYGCSLKAYRKDVAKNLLLYGDLHRFIPVLADLYGAKMTEMVVTHHPRKYGKSKYGIGRTYRVILDLMLMLFFQKFATRPLQFFGLNGGLIFSTGFLIELYLTWVKFWQGRDIGNRPLLLLGMLLIIAGIVLGGIGLIAELVMRTYYESSGRRIYTVREVLQ